MGTCERHGARDGFTLIELSIVLVIIGLIVGGVLVGQNLINAAGVRATITQVEKFNTAANTFFGKYGYLPGDIPTGPAAQFGFAARGAFPGQGDGNGLIQGQGNTAGGALQGTTQFGEPILFWMDLTSAGGQNLNLIEGNFSTPGYLNTGGGANLALLFPTAKIGNGNYFYVYSGGTTGSDSINYFGMSVVTNINGGGNLSSNPGLTVQQAYAIDTKMDDGLPQMGRVITSYIDASCSGDACWAPSLGGGVGPNTSATAGSSNTCYDNSATANGTPGVSGATQHYSVEINGGSNVNCALSFRLQAGD
jgi:prepilin-type N-terminal cleavage/methylation domain-containing protein